MKRLTFAVDDIDVMCLTVIVAWMVIGMIGAFLFILIQLVLLVDFAHMWNESLIVRYEETQSKKWFFGKCQISNSLE